MNPFNPQAVLAKIDEISQQDNTDIDPRMVKTKPEAVADCKAFVMRNAELFKLNTWVTPMHGGRIQLEFARNGRSLEIEFDGKGHVITLAYCQEDASNGDGAKALLEWLNQG